MDDGKNTQEANLPGRAAENRGPGNDGPPVTAPAAPPAMEPGERRKRARISETPPPPPPPPRLDDYEPIIGRPELDELHFLARQLRGKTVKMVNSTAVGGGVA